MDDRTWGIIGGVVLVLALLSPLVLGSAQKVERLFEAAEALYERSEYESAIEKYSEALRASTKWGAKTERIDEDFATLANYKISLCYYQLAENTGDVAYYGIALVHIKKVALGTRVAKYQEALTYLWAQILYKIAQFEQAKAKFTELIENFPSSRLREKAWYNIGNINYKQQNYEEARHAFQKLLDEFPNSEFTDEVRQRLAELMLENSNPFSEFDEPASDSFEPDSELDVKAMFNAAANLKQQGRPHEALQQYSDLVIQFPESQYVTDAYIAMGDTYVEMKDYENARANYENALYNTDNHERKIEIYEAYQRTYLVPVYARHRSKMQEITTPKNSGLIEANRLRLKGHFVEAAKQYETLAKTSNFSDEDKFRALYWAGRCYHNAALFSKSVQAFQILIADYGDRQNVIEAYHGLALAYTDWAQTQRNQSKWLLVIETVDEANKKYANTDRTWVSRTLGRMNLIKDRAVKNLGNSVPAKSKPDTRPNVPVQEDEKLVERSTHTLKISYVNQGYTYLGQGKLTAATEKAREALHIDGTDTRAHGLMDAIKETHYGQALALIDNNRHNQAIAEFKKSINIDKNFEEAHCNLGVIYIEQEVYPKAIEALKEAVRIDPGFIEAYFNLGLAYLRLGRFKAAKNAANAALSIDANYKPARRLLDSIAD